MERRGELAHGDRVVRRELHEGLAHAGGDPRLAIELVEPGQMRGQMRQGAHAAPRLTSRALRHDVIVQ